MITNHDIFPFMQCYSLFSLDVAIAHFLHLFLEVLFVDTEKNLIESRPDHISQAEVLKEEIIVLKRCISGPETLFYGTWHFNLATLVHSCKFLSELKPAGDNFLYAEREDKDYFVGETIVPSWLS